MPNSQATRRVHPAILARARELRREMTPQERKLWRHLRGKQLYGLKFRRQHPIYRFILDFYCHQHKLAVEIDGHSHFEPSQQEYDQARTEWLTQQGMRMIRFTNHDVETNIKGVLDEIARACGVGADPPLPPSTSPHWGEDLPPSSSPQWEENLPPSNSPQRGEGPDFPPTGGD